MALPPSRTTDSQVDSQGPQAEEAWGEWSLNSDQLRVLSIICGAFATHGIWPKLAYVDDQLDRRFQLDIREITPLPADLSNLSRQVSYINAEDEVWATPLGLFVCREGRITLGNFVKFLRWCADREKAAPAATPGKVEYPLVTSAEAEADLGFSPLELAQVFRLLQFEPVAMGRGGSADLATWNINLSREIRRYRNLASVEQYLAMYRRDVEKRNALVQRPFVSSPPVPNMLRSPLVEEAGESEAAGSNARTVVTDKPSAATSDASTPVPVILERDRPSESFASSLDDLHPSVRGAAERLFRDGHYPQAVTEGAKGFRDFVRKQAGGIDLDGKELIAEVLNEKHPLIRLADLTTETGRNIQEGYKLLGLGAFVGLRNPGAHEIQNLSPREAFEMLAVFSLMARRIEAGVLVAAQLDEEQPRPSQRRSTALQPDTALRVEPLEGSVVVAYSEGRLKWFLHFTLYVYPIGKTPIVVPHHSNRGRLEVVESGIDFRLRYLAALPAERFGSESRTIHGTQTELVVDEAGAIEIINQPNTEVFGDGPHGPAKVTVEFAPTRGERVGVRLDFDAVSPGRNEWGRWTLRKGVESPAEATPTA